MSASERIGRTTRFTMPLSRHARASTSGIAAGPAARLRGRGLFAACALAAALACALYATSLSKGGHARLGVAFTAVSLLLAAVASLKTVPSLARRSLAGKQGWRVRYELTREGGVYFAIIALIAIASLNTGNNLLFVILAILLAGILASGMLAKAALSSLEINLALPEHLFAMENAKGKVTISNKKRFLPAFSLTLRPRVCGDPAMSAGNDRGIVITRTVYAPYVPARSSIAAAVELRFTRRGLYPQSSFEVSSKFPFSILRRKYVTHSGGGILVLPSINSSVELALAHPRLRGDTANPVRGDGEDFYAIRGYRAGDAARHIDWKSTAKARQFMVREFTREESVRLILCFDAEVSSPISPALHLRFDRAVDLCASLAWEAHVGGILLKFIGGGLETPTAPAGEIIYEVLEKLAVIEPITSANGEESAPFPARSWSEEFPVIITDRPDNPLLKRISPPSRIVAMQDLARAPL